MFDPGTCIGDLVVEGQIGQGSHAAIFQVVTPEGVLAALKVLTTKHPVAMERLRAEGTSLLHLSHPNIVGVYRLLEVQGSPALLMELVEGPALGTWLDARVKPDVAEALELFKGIARGVHAAHARGLVHRDLNPGNVLLATEGDHAVVPKVTDFGIARILDREAGLTVAGPLGTPAYVAPEQWRDARQADQRSDIFSLGCILYELVTGVRAFQGGELEAYQKASRGEYLPACKARPDCPEYVAGVIDRMLRPEPGERYPDIASALEVLYLDDVPEPDAPSAEGRAWSVSRLSTQGASLARHLAPEVDTTTTASHALATPEPEPEQLPWTVWGSLAVAMVVLVLLALLFVL